MNRIDRIKSMEERLDRAEKAVREAEKALDDYNSALDDIKALLFPRSRREGACRLLRKRAVDAGFRR